MSSPVYTKKFKVDTEVSGNVRASRTGAEIARLFGVYQTLEPIFKFQYIEASPKLLLPPKHNHASASNVGRRQQPLKVSNADPHQLSANTLKKRTNPEHEVPESLRKRGRPKRVPLQKRHRPELSTSNNADSQPNRSKHGHFHLQARFNSLSEFCGLSFIDSPGYRERCTPNHGQQSKRP
ncbi:hypothetical protein CJJ09_005435 [Candidozyma auris]|nr:hypothetical protein CJJ09_005435 [[Candida] auris]